MRRRTRKRHGGLYIELLVCVCVLMALIATLIYIPPLYTHKQGLDYMARKLVRAAEMAGSTANLDTLAATLEDQLSVNPDITWDIPDESKVAEDATGQKIQLRTTFTLTLADVYHVPIMDPMFSDPITIDIPITVKLTGVSEVYWK